MTSTFLPLLAEGTVRHVFEWGRIQSNTDWILPIGICVAIMVFVRYMYRRDAAELHPVLGWLLTLLRTATFFGLLILYLDPQWRSQREEIRNSRAAVLVDTSLSMGLADEEGLGNTTPRSRVRQVAAALAETELLDQLRETHDVIVMQFGESLDRDRVRTLKKAGPSVQPPADRPTTFDGRRAEAAELGGGRLPGDPRGAADDPVDWNEMLAPRGTETRLGLALRQAIDEEAGSPLSGIILFTDGGQNAGLAPEVAVRAARQARVPVFPVGLGSDRKPANGRVSDLVVPARAYPGDSYVVTGFIQAQQMAGRVAGVELLSREAGSGAPDSGPGSGEVLASQQVVLGADGEVVPVRFELTPDRTGRRTVCFRVQTLPGDGNPADNLREADIEIVDRKNLVLMLAGGPTREYRFLRTQLYRDRSTTLHVLLQSAQENISQEADKLLDDFPATREEMFQYDCIVAFDPDWQALSLPQVDLLEQWVAEQGGGLVVIAGPVYTGRTIGGWIADPDMADIRALYPVEFYRRFAVVEEGMYVAEEPQPLEFSRQGLEASYLWLQDSATAGRQAWAGFPGVYSHCPVRGAKPGAVVLARLSEPGGGPAGNPPVFFAEHFYGSGRVFFIGSGELWRLRKLDVSYFEAFYTKLIRHVSQGRLLRGSTRGVLLVGKERYLLGNTVEVRAQLTNARLEPLQMAKVNLLVVLPDSSVQTVPLQADPGRDGSFMGQFPVLEEGSYRLELPVPESEDERLIRRIQVNVPDLERQNPQRNDALLSRIAKGTGGKYYVGVGGLVDPAGEPVAELLKDRTKTDIIPLAPDTRWEQLWLAWMMGTLCGLLCVEWLTRRLSRLA